MTRRRKELDITQHRDSTWDNQAMGLAVVGGAEESTADRAGVRQVAGWPRVLTTGRLTPVHWYCLRLLNPRETQTGLLSLQDLASDEKNNSTLAFGERRNAPDLCKGDSWSPRWPELNSLMLRLGEGVQV